MNNKIIISLKKIDQEIVIVYRFVNSALEICCCCYYYFSRSHFYHELDFRGLKKYPSFITPCKGPDCEPYYKRLRSNRKEKELEDI